MGLSRRLEWPGDFHTLAADRIRKGFSAVQIVAGLYPECLHPTLMEPRRVVIRGRSIILGSILTISIWQTCEFATWPNMDWLLVW
jgi:hypothetical protein